MITTEQIKQRQDLETSLQITREKRKLLDQKMKKEVEDKIKIISKKYEKEREKKMKEASDAENASLPYEDCERLRLEHKLAVHAQNEQETLESQNIYETYRQSFYAIDEEEEKIQKDILAFTESIL